MRNNVFSRITILAVLVFNMTFVTAPSSADLPQCKVANMANRLIIKNACEQDAHLVIKGVDFSESVDITAGEQLAIDLEAGSNISAFVLVFEDEEGLRVESDYHMRIEVCDNEFSSPELIGEAANVPLADKQFANVLNLASEFRIVALQIKK